MERSSHSSASGRPGVSSYCSHIKVTSRVSTAHIRRIIRNFFHVLKIYIYKKERISVEADAEGRIRPLKATVVIAFYMVAGRDRGTRNNCGTHRCERVLHLQTRLNASLHNLGRGENNCVILFLFWRDQKIIQ